MAQRTGRIELPFTSGFYLSRSKPLSAQRCINWYPNTSTSDALSQENLYQTPGLRAVVDEISGLGRGSYEFNGVLYVVVGSYLYSIDRIVNYDGSSSYRSFAIGLILGSEKVIFASTHLEMVILVPDGECYCFTQSTGILTRIDTATNFLAPAVDVVAVDSYFVFAQSNSKIIFHSDINNGLVYDALNYYQVTQLDYIRGLVAFQNNIYVIGDYLTVPFYDAGELEFAFRPIPSSAMDYGMSGPYAKTPFRGSFVFLGKSKNAETVVYLFSGSQPQRISNETIDFILQSQTPEDLAAASVMRHSQNGGEFVVIHIGDWCFVYDLVTGKWHERRSRILGAEGYIDAPWRVQSITQAYNSIFVTDKNSGLVGVIDDETYTEYGTAIYRDVILQPFTNFGVAMKVWSIEPFVDVGYNVDDNLEMRWSDDGGFNWSDFISKSLGDAGDFGRRVIFNRLGSFPKTRTLWFRYTGANKCSFNKLMANAQ